MYHFQHLMTVLFHCEWNIGLRDLQIIAFCFSSHFFLTFFYFFFSFGIGIIFLLIKFNYLQSACISRLRGACFLGGMTQIQIMCVFKVAVWLSCCQKLPGVAFGWRKASSFREVPSTTRILLIHVRACMCLRVRVDILCLTWRHLQWTLHSIHRKAS